MIAISDLTKIYKRGRGEVRALDRVTFKVEDAEFITLFGPSAAGKTTLLNIIGGLDLPTSGEVLMFGKELTKKEMTNSRRKNTGFIFADFYLIPTLNAVENVMMPQLWSGSVNYRRARELMALVGLEHRLRHYPSELSGGEMQRVAIARSLVNDPKILLADEPTANLDTATRDKIIGLFRALNRDRKITVILATHDPECVSYADRCVRLAYGKIEP
jgi:putative ABC transport system ATP-binding protein